MLKLTKNDDDSTRHVLASVVANTFHNGYGTGITDAEALGCNTTQEDAARSGSIKASITDDDVLLCAEWTFLWWVDNHFASRQTFGYVIVRLTFKGYVDATGEKSAKTLTCRPLH